MAFDSLTSPLCRRGNRIFSVVFPPYSTINQKIFCCFGCSGLRFGSCRLCLCLVESKKTPKKKRGFYDA